MENDKNLAKTTGDVSIEILKSVMMEQNLQISEYQIAQIEKLYTLVCEKNKFMNLTTITKREDFFVKHIIDSVIAQKHIKQNASVVDLGCGGGFPSLPLKIVRPDLVMLSVDATNKKIEFVKDAISQLELKEASAKTARAETMGQGSEREKFDVVVSRAVAALNILLELALPLVKLGGVFIAYKTDQNECENIENALLVLGAELETIEEMTLPNGDHRCIMVFRKTKKTNAGYPRDFGKIKKKPL